MAESSRKAFYASFQTIRFDGMNPLLISAILGLLLGTLNYLYFRKKGYTSYGQLYLSIIAYFGLSLLFLKYLL
jgi:hypothetical protein